MLPDLKTQICAACGEEKQLSAFQLRTDRNVWDKSCKECRAAASRKHYAQLSPAEKKRRLDRRNKLSSQRSPEQIMEARNKNRINRRKRAANEPK